MGPTEVVPVDSRSRDGDALSFFALMMVAGAAGVAQLNGLPSGQTARYGTLAVGSVSSVSGDSKPRVLRTEALPLLSSRRHIVLVRGR